MLPSLLAIALCTGDPSTWVPEMLRQLPTYINRAQQQSRARRTPPLGNVILTTRAEFEPLPLPTGSALAAPQQPNPTRQVFFSSLSRVYSPPRHAGLVQGFHWLFLAPGEPGWQFVSLYSRWGAYPRGDQPVSERQEDSQGSVGLGVQQWLRDCRSAP